MSHITVNQKYSFEIEQKGKAILFNGKEVMLDIQKLEKETFHILYKDRSYTAEVVSLNQDDKEMRVKINGNEYLVTLRDEYDALLKSLGMESTLKNGAANLKAPMPGLVLDIMVQVGDAVNKGENLVILEAMKMENIIKSPNDVVIKSIEIEKGAKVEKNQLLISFE